MKESLAVRLNTEAMWGDGSRRLTTDDNAGKAAMLDSAKWKTAIENTLSISPAATENKVNVRIISIDIEAKGSVLVIMLEVEAGPTAAVQVS